MKLLYLVIGVNLIASTSLLTINMDDLASTQTQDSCEIQISEIKKHFTDCRADVISYNTKLNQFQLIIQTLDNETKRLKSEVNKYESAIINNNNIPTQIEVLNQRNETLVKENKEYRLEIEELKMLLLKSKEDKQNQNGCTNEINYYKEMSTQLKVEINNLSYGINDLTRINQELRAQLTEVNTLRLIIAKLKDELNNIALEKSKLESQIYQLTFVVNESKMHEETIKQLRDKVTELNIKIQETSITISYLKAEVERTDSQINVCNQKNSDIDTLTTYLKNTELQLKKVNEEHITCQNNISELNTIINQLNFEITKIKTNYDIEANQLTADNVTVREDNVKLINIIEDIRKRSNESQVEQCRRELFECNTLKEELNQKINKCSDIVNKLKVDIRTVINTNKSENGSNSTSIVIGNSNSDADY